MCSTIRVCPALVAPHSTLLAIVLTANPTLLTTSQGTTLSQYKKKGDNEPKRVLTVGSGWSVQRAAKAGDGFVLTAPGRVTKLRASGEQEEMEVGRFFFLLSAQLGVELDFDLT